MKGYLHLQPISKTWLLSYNKNRFTTSYISILNSKRLLEEDDNKEVDFKLEIINNKEVAFINYENL